MSLPYTDNVTLLDAVAADGNSAGFDVSKRQQITVEFIAASGDSTFSIDASNDGTNWISGIAFLDATATATGTYVTSKVLSSAKGGAIVKPGWRFLRVTVDWTSGTATAILQCGG